MVLVQFIDDSDAINLAKSFSELPFPDLCTSPKQFDYRFRISAITFVSDTARQLFMEWCLEKERISREAAEKDQALPILKPYGWDAVGMYYATGNPGIRQFVQDQTHHYLRDQESATGRFRWDDQRKIFVGLSTDEYIRARQDVLRGLSYKGIEFFAYNKNMDGEHLRGSLSNWIISAKKLVDHA